MATVLLDESSISIVILNDSECTSFPCSHNASFLTYRFVLKNILQNFADLQELFVARRLTEVAFRPELGEFLAVF